MKSLDALFPNLNMLKIFCKCVVRLSWFLVSMGIGALPCLPLPAFAWGVEGHQVIAQLAEGQLTPRARAQVKELLSQEPGQTLVSISTWADEHRSPHYAPLHYVNFPRGDCVYRAQRDCPDGRCVVEAIHRQAAVLASNAPPEARLLALKYLVHFVGDVHQPLHAGFHDDKGGNTYQLQAFMRGSNLHAVWDSGLIKHSGLTTDALSEQLVGRIKPAPWTPEIAAQESCRIVNIPDFYPDRLVTPSYIDHYQPVMLGRLALGGSRLAEILNETLGR